VDGIEQFVHWHRKSGVPLRDLPRETALQVRGWRRALRDRKRFEATIFGVLYDICEAELEDAD
jgi:hypothetical protein